MTPITRFYQWIVNEAANNALGATEYKVRLGTLFQRLIVQVADAIFSTISKQYQSDKEAKIAELREKKISVLPGKWSYTAPSLKYRVEVVSLATHRGIKREETNTVIPEKKEDIPEERIPAPPADKEQMEPELTDDSQATVIGEELNEPEISEEIAAPVEHEEQKGEEAGSRWGMPRFRTLLKTAFLGMLVLGGGAAVKRLWEGADYQSDYSQGLRQDDARFDLNRNFEEARLDLHTFTHLREESPLHTDYWVDLGLLETQAGKTENLETVADKLSEQWNAFSSYFSSEEAKTEKVHPETPLTRMVEATPQDEIDDPMLTGILARAVGSDGEVAEASYLKPVTGRSFVYLTECLKLMGNNPEQRKVAAGLVEAVKGVEAFGESVASFVPEWNAAADKWEKFAAEGAEQENEEAEAEQPETLESAFSRTVAGFRTFMTQQMDIATEQGFYLPLEGSGSIAAFIPEMAAGSSSRFWTVRLFSLSDVNAPYQEGHKPYRQVRGIAREEILHDAVLKDILSRSMAVRFTGNAYPAASTIINTQLDKISRYRRTNFLTYFLSTAGRPRSEIHSSIYIHPTRPASDSEALLTDILYAEMGPEAALDYQLSTLRHYLDKHGASVGRKPQIYHLLARSLSSLAIAVERGADDGWISPDAVQEKERIIREADTVLKHAHIVLKKHLRESAPVVADETSASRLQEKGTLPQTEPEPLEKTGAARSLPPPYRPPVNLFPDAAPSLPVAPVELRAGEVADLAAAIKNKPNDPALTGRFRSWVESVRQDKGIIESLAPDEVKAMIGHVADIAEKLAASKLPEGEAAAALADAVSVADALMRHAGDPKLSNAYLPVGRIAGQFANPGLFGADPRWFKDAGRQVPPGGQLYFGEAVVGSQVTGFRRLEELGLPWSDLKMIRSDRPVEDLPPHVILKALSKGDLPKTSKKAVCQAYGLVEYYGKGKEEGKLSNELEALHKIVSAAARRSAAAMTKRIEEVSEKAESRLVADPKEVAAAIQEWTRFLGYSHIDPLTLEMLTPEQVGSLFDSIGKLSAAFMKANYLAGNLLPGPETMLVQIELMVFADRVMAHSPEKLHNHFYMPLESFAPIIDGEVPFFRTLDPFSDNERLQGVRDWLAERRFGYIQDGLVDHVVTKFPIITYFDGFLSPHNQFIQDDQPRSVLRKTGCGLREGRFVFPFILSSHASRPYRLNDFYAHDMTNPNALKWQLETYAGAQNEEEGNPAQVPGWFYGLRDLVFYSFHTMRGGLPPIEGKVASPDDLDVEVRIKEHGFFGLTNRYEIIHNLKGITDEDYAGHPDIPDGARTGHLFSHLDPVIESEGVVKELRDLYRFPNPNERFFTQVFGRDFDIDVQGQNTVGSINNNAIETFMRPGIEIPHRDVNDLNAAMVRDAEGLRGIYSSDQYRIKWSLAAEPDLQTFLTLSTYMDNPEWLTHLEEQREFTNLLFDPGLLWRHLQEPHGVGPAAEAELAGFFFNQYHTHAGKPELQLFFAEMGLRLYQYSAMARTASPEAYAGHPVPKSLQSLWNLPENILKQPSSQPVDRSSYGAMRALQYLDKRELGPDEAVDFVKCVLSYRTFAPRVMVNALHTDRQIDQMMARFADSIRKAVYKEGSVDQDVISKMTREIIGEMGPFASDESNPYFLSNPSGSVTINLREGVVYQEGMKGVFLPAEVRQSNAYVSVFGNQAFRASIIDRSTYKFTDSGGNVFFAQKAKDGSRWLLYRQFEGSEKTYRLVTADWTEWDNASGRHVPIPWIKSDWILSHNTHWYHEGATPEMRVLDREGSYRYRVALGGPEGKTVESVYRVDSQGNDEAVLGDVDQEEYKWFAQFADKGMAHVWLTKDGKQARELEFPGHGPEGLHFKWTDKGWQYTAAPQYFVAPRQLNPLFPGQQNYLLLKTVKGEERLLIPRLRPEGAKGNALDINVQFDRKLSGWASHHDLMVFDKNPKSGRYVGNSPEANLYLAMLHLSHRDYANARTALLEMKELSRSFTAGEKQILDWIVESTRLPSDTTSQAIAIRTLAAYAREDNDRKYPARRGESENVLYKCPKPLKEEYLRRFESLATLRLPLSDEVSLFKDLLISGSEPVEKSLARMQAIDPEAAKEALDAVLPKLLFGKQAVDLETAIERANNAVNTCAVPFPAALEQGELDAWIVKLPQDTTPQTPPPSVVDEDAEWFKVLSGPTKELMRKYDRGAKVFHESRDHSLYRVEDAAAMHRKRLALEQELQSMTRDMESLRLKVIHLANQLPTDPAEAQKLLLRLEAGTEQPVTFDKMIGAFSLGKLTGYKALNTLISDERAEEIDLALQTFMDMLPAWNHRTVIVQALTGIEDALKSSREADSLSLQGPLHQLINAVGQQRYFSPDAPRLTKVMEFQSGAYYRKVQVTSLENMGIGKEEGYPSAEGLPSAVHRVAVGQGKTSRILPSMARYYAEKGESALVMMPEAQLPSAGREFSQIFKDVYGTPTVTFELTRNEASLEFLQSKDDHLKEAKRLGQPVLTCGKSMRVLRNLLVENDIDAILNIRKGNPEVDALGKAHALRGILDTLETRPLIDELHKEYDTRVETNHPFGEAKSLPEEYGVAILNLYEILRDDPQIRSLMHFNFIPEMRQESAGPFTKERFKEEIAPIISNAFLQRLRTSGSSLDSELIPLAEYIVPLNDSQLKDIDDYLLQRSSKEVIEVVGKLPQQVKDLLALVRGQLNVLMPTALDRNFGEKYGFVSAADIIPTPFSAAGVPNKGSQFSSPFERFDYMIQSLFHEGPRLPMIESIVRDLRRERVKALSKNEIKEGEQELGVRIETEADKVFSRIFMTQTLNLDHEGLEQKLMQIVTNNPGLMRHLVKTYALPQVKVFPRNLKATSQHLGNLFKGWNGVSGTPNNYPTYPGEFELPKDEAVIGRMLTLIRENSIGSVHTVKGTAPKDLLSTSACLAADAFIDAGGVFANEPIEEVLAVWSEKSGKATVWVDRDAGIVVKQKPEDKPVSLRAVQVPPEARKCFYAQPDITGTDIAHRKNAVGIVSISKGMTFTDLEQAAGRMRGIENEGQKVELLIMDDDAVVIRQKLGLDPGRELTVDLVIRYLMINESEKLNADSSTALHHKLRGVIDNYFFNWLKRQDPKDIAFLDGIDDLLMRVFFPEVSTSPFELYGHADELMPRETAFENEIEGLIGANSPLAGAIRKVFDSESDTILSTLKRGMEALRPNLAYVNEKVSSRPPVDMEQEQELLQDQEVEQFVELEQEVNLQQENQQQKTSDKTPDRHNPWARLTTRDIASWLFWRDVDLLPVTGNDRVHPNRFHSIPIFLHDQIEREMMWGLFDNNVLASSNVMSVTEPMKPAQLAVVVKKRSGPETQEPAYKIIFIEPWEAVRLKQALNARDGAKLPAGPFEVAMNPYTYDYGVKDPEDKFYFNGEMKPDRSGRVTNSGMGQNGLVEGWRLSIGKASEPISPEQKDAEVWVGDFNGRRAVGDAGAFDWKDPEFRRLWIQAQIIAGKTQFTPEEIPLVREWLEGWLRRIEKYGLPNKWSTSGATRVERLDAVEKFIKKILSQKQDVLAAYPRSDLAKIIHELKGK